MKTLRLSILAVVATGIIIVGYVFGVKQLERLGQTAYYRLIVKKLVIDKSSIATQNVFLLGVYRPELPYQFGMLWTIQERLGASATIVSYYQAWGDGAEYEFKSDINRNLHDGGYIPLITWEPWVSGFSRYKDMSMDSSLAKIVQGEFDAYIHNWAQQAVRFGKPFFLRPGHEMSNPWYSWSVQHGNSPELFKKFWRHVHAIFQEEGAHNVAFVWNPYLPSDTACYPGDDVVDWVGLDVFNFGSLSESGMWLDFYTVTKILYDAVKGYNKPILIAETGCVPGGGNKNNWYRDMFHYLAVDNFPLVKALVLFDTPLATSPTGIPVDLSFSSDEEVYVAIDKNELLQKIRLQPFPKKKE